MMEIRVLDLNGNEVRKLDLEIEKIKIRDDLIKRAFLATQSKKRQPYGTDKLAGKRSAAHYHGRRDERWSMMNREMARMPRIHGKTTPHLIWEARIVPQARKGREAHPPKVEKIWEQKINKKERKQAILSAIAASLIAEWVKKRGHKIKEVKVYPIVVEDELEKISKTKELKTFLERIGLKEELQRAKKKKVRAGKGKLRGRRYKRKKSILFVISEDKGISKAVKNLPGCNVVKIENLSVEHLAPGGMPGRITVWSESAIKKLKEKLKNI
jgi:large subunit ribosomal protein L4e